jgi:hypothetical protein
MFGIVRGIIFISGKSFSRFWKSSGIYRYRIGGVLECSRGATSWPIVPGGVPWTEGKWPGPVGLGAQAPRPSWSAPLGIRSNP